MWGRKNRLSYKHFIDRETEIEWPFLLTLKLGGQGSPASHLLYNIRKVIFPSLSFSLPTMESGKLKDLSGFFQE